MESIVFDRVTKVYQGGLKKETALDGLSLEISRGTVFGFLGPNGAGKSTAIKILLHIIFPTSGRAYLLGQPVTQKAVRSQVGYLPENPYFYDHLTPEELLWFGGRTCGMTTAQIRERTGPLLERVGLSHVSRRPLRTFSKGMIQRAGLALALIHDPQVVVLDEPMSGLDPLGRRLMSQILQTLRMEGKTIFLSSHILHDVEDLCDNIGIIAKGRLRLTASLSDLFSASPKGWRVTVRGEKDALSAASNGCSWTVSARGELLEVQAREEDLYKLLDQLRGCKCKVISAVPLRQTLEEIFLQEIHKVGGELR